MHHPLLVLALGLGLALAMAGAHESNPDRVTVHLDRWSELQDDLHTSEERVRTLLQRSKLDLHPGPMEVNVTSAVRFTTTCIRGQFTPYREAVEESVWHEHRLLQLPERVELTSARVVDDVNGDELAPTDAHIAVESAKRVLTLRSRAATGRTLRVDVCMRQGTQKVELPHQASQYTALLPLFENSAVRRVHARVDHDDVRAVLTNGRVWTMPEYWHGVDFDAEPWTGDVTRDAATNATLVSGYAPTHWKSAMLVWGRAYGAPAEDEEMVEEVALVVHADERTMLHMRNTLVRSTTTLAFSVAQGVMTTSEIALTRPMRILSVEGADWRMEDDGAGRRVLMLTFPHAVRGGMHALVTVRAELDTPAQVPGKAARVKVPRYRVLGARHTGMLAISTADNLEVHEHDVAGLMRRDPAEVRVPGEGAGPIVFAYQFVTPEHTIEVACTVHADATVLVTAASAAHVDISLVENRAFIRMRALVRNTGSQFLRVHVPNPRNVVTDVNVWSASIDNHVVKPAVERGMRNLTTVLLPLSEEHSRNSQFAIEVVFFARINTTLAAAEWAGESGTLALPVPQLSAPINELSLTLNLPERLDFSAPRAGEWARSEDVYQRVFYSVESALNDHLRDHGPPGGRQFYYARNLRTQQNVQFEDASNEMDGAVGGAPDVLILGDVYGESQRQGSATGSSNASANAPPRAPAQASQMNGTEFAGKLPVSVAALTKVGRTYHFARFLVQKSSMIELEWKVPLRTHTVVTRVWAWGDVTVEDLLNAAQMIGVLGAVLLVAIFIRKFVAFAEREQGHFAERLAQGSTASTDAAVPGNTASTDAAAQGNTASTDAAAQGGE